VTLSQLADQLGCRLEGDGGATIVGVADLVSARADEIALFAHPRYKAEAAATQAGAVIVADDAPALSRPLLRAKSPVLAFARALALFHTPPRPAPGISPHAAVGAGAVVDPSATIGPFVSIGAGARVGAGSILESHVAVGAGATIGRGCHVHAHVSLREGVVLGDRVVIQNGAVIGSDGYGFTRDAVGAHVKVPQIGIVVIEDDVEIGANTTIDRATTDATRIGDGTKIDNLVQIGHNVVTGRHCIIVAQVGISGSTELEDYVTIGGQAGIIGHVRLGKGAQIGAQSGVSKSVSPGATVFGTPASALSLFKRVNAYLQRLPKLFERTKQLEERIGKLEEREKESLR
jgi:UDP-3-O-[3-hydroxymyristoyl] glucosamine N-acyltransferase